MYIFVCGREISLYFGGSLGFFGMGVYFDFVGLSVVVIWLEVVVKVVSSLWRCRGRKVGVLGEWRERS